MLTKNVWLYLFYHLKPKSKYKIKTTHIFFSLSGDVMRLRFSRWQTFAHNTCKQPSALKVESHSEMRALPPTAEPTSWWMRQLLCSVGVVSRRGRRRRRRCLWMVYSRDTGVTLFLRIVVVWRITKTWAALWWSLTRRARRKCQRGEEVCGLTCQWVGEVSSNLASYWDCHKNNTRLLKLVCKSFFTQLWAELQLRTCACSSISRAWLTDVPDNHLSFLLCWIGHENAPKVLSNATAAFTCR